jgi:2-succinyl-6-hydroxy-2,4-cyclohexadiene-1-carboxylate synthase
MLLATSSAKMPSYWEHLERTHHPLRLIVGERDRKFVAIAHEVARRNPRSEVSVVAGAGHSVLLEKPLKLAKKLSFQ